MYKVAMLLLVLCVSVGAIAYAEPGSSYDPADRSQQGDTKTNMNVSNTQVTGTIQRIDLSKNSVMIREDKTDAIQRYKLTDSTTSSSQSSKMMASSLKVGDHVLMQVEAQSNRVVKIDKVKQ